MSYDKAPELNRLIEAANSLVVIQADNPDADSLGSALAMEGILADMGKTVHMYCGVDMPAYLRYISGWDRVQSEIPPDFDASILVDASTMTLLEKLSASPYIGRIRQKPAIVLDHHEIVENGVDFAHVIINEHTRASTGELIYVLAKQLGWPLSNETQTDIMYSILGDTQGLTNQLASAETYRIMAEMIDAGVSRPSLEEARREFGKMEPAIFSYKAELIKRSETTSDGRIASVVIPQAEISRYSPLYNPAPLIQGDMLQTRGVELAIVFKQYNDGKITGAIRANATAPVAARLAEHMGGGGHAFASGFKVVDGRSFNEVKSECLKYAQELLNSLNENI